MKYVRSYRLSFYPFQIVEPYISTQDHIQVSIPGILTIMGAESMSRLDICVPRTHNESLVLVTLVQLIASGEEGLKDPQREWEGS